MDEMRVGSRFMSMLLGKLIERGIRKCCGVKVKVNLNSVACTYNDGGKATIAIKDFKLELPSKDLEKVVFGKLDIEEEET